MKNIATFRSKTVIKPVRTDYVYIAGERFELYDLRETIFDIRDSQTYLTNLKMIKALIKSEVITSGGAQYIPAYEGPNYDKLLNELDKRIKIIHKDRKRHTI